MSEMTSRQQALGHADRRTSMLVGEAARSFVPLELWTRPRSLHRVYVIRRTARAIASVAGWGDSRGHSHDKNHRDHLPRTEPDGP